MRYSICSADPGVIADARDAGFDCVEAWAPILARPGESEAAFEDAAAALLAPGLPVEAANGFLLEGMRCTGPDANHDVIVEYAAGLLRRLRKAGVAICVFGSGWARAIPEGWPREKAEEQFVSLLSRLGPVAAENGVEIAIEPLARVECNFVNTVDEGARFARASGSDAVGVLADFFHWKRNGEGADTILAAKDRFIHAHVATVPGRLAPGAEECDFGGFFRALASIGYDGRVSLECAIPPPESRVASLRSALASLRAFLAS